jgi:hypothetical protein
MNERDEDLIAHLEQRVAEARRQARVLPALERELREVRGELPVMALRPDPDHPDEMDDIVVENVTLFRAEANDLDSWWMACHFANGEQVTFGINIAPDERRIQIHVTDTPDEWADFDAKEESDAGADT